MPYLKEAQKRDFISQMIVLSQDSSAIITEQGFDLGKRIDTLKVMLEEARQAEGEQIEAMVKAKEATIKSKEKLSKAYAEASKTVDLFAGLLGKDHSLIREMRKLRK